MKEELLTNNDNDVDDLSEEEEEENLLITNITLKQYYKRLKKLILKSQSKKFKKELTQTLNSHELITRDSEEFTLFIQLILEVIFCYLDFITLNDQDIDIYNDVLMLLMNHEQFHVDLNWKDEKGQTILFKAACLDLVDNIKVLIELGADPTKPDNDGRTPLAIAASLGHAASCQLFTSLEKYPINQPDLQGNTPLSLAVIGCHLDAVVQLLLDAKVNVNKADLYGWTPLMLASHLGYIDLIEPLLAAGANRDLIALNKKNAIELALENKHNPIAKRLVSFSKISDKYKHIPKRDKDITIKEKKKEIKKEAKKESFMKFEDSFMKDLSLSSCEQLEIQSRLKRNSSLGKSRNASPKEETIDGNSSFSETRKLVRNGTLRNRKIYNQLVENELQMEQNEVPLSNLSNNLENEEGPKEGIRTYFNLSHLNKWEYFSRLLTICVIPPFLSKLGGMKDPHIQQAWREKVALCFIILMISFGLGFLTFGFSSIICQKIIPIFPDQVARDFGIHANGTKLMIVRGQLYDVGSYFPVGNHRPILPFVDEDLKDTIEPYYGHDISHIFPPDKKSSSCKFWPKNFDEKCKGLQDDPKLHCHTSAESWRALRELSIKNYVAFSWTNITNSINNDKLFVFNEKVYTLKDYFLVPEEEEEDPDLYLGEELTEVLKSFIGRDATKDILNNNKLAELIPCFEDQLLVGKLDGTTIGCFASNLAMVIATSILLTITVIKFLAAISFDWFLSWKLGKISNKPRNKDTLPHLLCLVTCYSEGESSLKTTLDSIALSDYYDKHKILFVIADGDITGSGNEKSTPDILLDMLEPLDKDEEIKPKAYISIGDAKKQMNMAKVHIGNYVVQNDRRVPMVLINKCGLPYERSQPKAGNRGKRDSQLILMRFLSNLCFNERMTPLEFDLFEKLYRLTNTTADKYEMVLMVDADTMVLPDAISKMVSAMERDPTVMGLCGETKIENKRQSWVTMIQVYEYYISHHLGKAFESIFGGVTCLPGCFCMYRIKVSKPDGYCVPILANPDIVKNYSSNDVSTLHKKNLLLLGEDRYLTTLMLRAFPRRKMIYVPKAICKTVVPDEFKVLLSQRRRWINSTVHNLLELVLVPQLCGIFCCSMQFVILLELLGTVVMPASLLFLSYLIVSAFMGQDVWLPLFFMACLYFMQAILIGVTTRKVSYIGWMFIFILAMPIWNFVLPVYSFWHFDDFSWGATRKIDGPDNGHGDSNGEKEDEMECIEQKKIGEWQKLSNKKKEKRMSYQAKAEQNKLRSIRIQELELAKNFKDDKLKQYHQTLNKIKLVQLKENKIEIAPNHETIETTKALASPTSPSAEITTEELFFEKQNHERPKSVAIEQLNTTLKNIPKKPNRRLSVDRTEDNGFLFLNQNNITVGIQPPFNNKPTIDIFDDQEEVQGTILKDNRSPEQPPLELGLSRLNLKIESNIYDRPKTLPRGPRLDNKFKEIQHEDEGFDNSSISKPLQVHTVKGKRVSRDMDF